jgi:hypothetical protein
LRNRKWNLSRTQKSKEKEEETENSQIEKSPDFISGITPKIKTGTLDPLDILLIDEILSS